jgi:hypothetical protein
MGAGTKETDIVMTSLNKKENLLVSNLDCWTGMLVCKLGNDVTKVKVKRKKGFDSAATFGKGFGSYNKQFNSWCGGLGSSQLKKWWKYQLLTTSSSFFCTRV